MPRSSGIETIQKKSIKGSSQLRISSSDSKTDRNTKQLGVGDGRSPRGGTLSDPPPPVNRKKLGTRIDHLESQLGQAQEELKSLKEQLVSAEDAKKVAQEQLDEEKPKKPVVETGNQETQKPKGEEIKKNRIVYEISEENLQETDVFEVPIEKLAIEEEEAVELEIGNAAIESTKILEQKDSEINELKATLELKEKELEEFFKENESLKNQLLEKSIEISTAKFNEEKTTQRLNQAIKNLEENKNNALQIHQKFEQSESVKTALETEMKKLRVQTEQWRKAADAAAAVLSGEVDMAGRRVSERRGSIDNHIGRVFEASGGGGGGGYNDGYIGGSPCMTDDIDDVFGGSKRKGSGIKMFGDLWKKKGHK